jgi:tripartite-type tricarboxylate transporter receptor subunit TctC
MKFFDALAIEISVFSLFLKISQINKEEKMKKMRTVMGSLILVLLLLTMAFNVAWAKYPERPITLIVLFTAGGGADLSARALSTYAEKALGQPIIVVNKPGAGGTVGVSAIAAARPDGYTIGTTGWAPMTMAPHMENLAYDPLKDLDFIMIYGKYMYGPVVRSDSPFKTLKDMVAYARANPSKIKYSSVGIATPNNFGMLQIAKAEGIKWDNVVFKGAPEGVAACLGGHVDAVSQNPTDVLPYINAGKMRLLVSMSKERWPWVPDVPTVRELGYNFDVSAYTTLSAPKGVPKDILDKLRDVFKQATNDPAFQQVMERIFIPVEYSGTDEFRRRLGEDYKQNEKLILELGLHKSQKK